MTDPIARLGRAMVDPFADPSSRTFWPFLLIAALLAIAIEARRRGLRASLHAALAPWRHPSAALDVQLLLVRQLLGLLGWIPRIGFAWLLATALVRTLDGSLGRPANPAVPAWGVTVAYSLVAFLAWDASRFVLHKALHASPLLWQFHQVHHSAEVLTPLTFHRIHPVESVLHEARSALVTGVLAGVAYWLFRDAATIASVFGVEALGFWFNAATGNLRHSHVWLRFGPSVERWLLSPAQHQLHHSADGAAHGCNYGTWLAVWDRWDGTLRLAGATPPRTYGIDRNRNHDGSLVGALVGPFLAARRQLRGRRAGALALAALAISPARAQDGEDDDEGEHAPPPSDPAPSDEPGEFLLVEERVVPRVAGSAHEITEEELERQEHNDIHKVLQQVPGVYVRQEDGYGLRPNIGMRGGNSDRSSKITLLEDGLPLAPAPYAAPAAYYFPLATRLTGVQIFKGAASIRHGPQTIGGAIDFRTRDVPEETSGALDLAGGSYEAIKAHGWVGVVGPSAGLVLEGAHLSSGGFKELDGGGPTGFERQDALLKLRLVNAGEIRNAVELKLGYGRESSHETYLGLTLEDFEAEPYRRYAASSLDVMDWQHTQESLAWDVSFGRAFAVRTVAYHHWLGRAWTKLNGFQGGPDLHDLLQDPDGGQAAVYLAVLRGDEDSTSTDQELLVGTNDRAFHNGGVQSVARHRLDGQHVGHELEVGVRVHVDHVVRLHTEDPYAMQSGELVPTGAETATTLDSVGQARALALWVAEDLRLGALHLYPGIRSENIVTFSGTSATRPQDPATQAVLLPGIGASYDASPALLFIAGLHRGFSPVAPGQDPSIDPELAWNGEAGFRLTPGETATELVGFWSEYDNLSGSCTLSGGCADDQIDQQYNGGEARVMGLEAGARHVVLLPWEAAFVLGANYTFTHATFRTGFTSGFPQWGSITPGDELPYVPAHQASAGVTYDAARGSIGISGTYRGAMRDVAGQGPIAEADIPAATLFDLAGELALTKRIRAYVTVTNFTDAAVLESWRPFGARPAAPFLALAGIKVGPIRDAWSPP
jgi:Fe(3+) dicitrate transport protein